MTFPRVSAERFEDTNNLLDHAYLLVAKSGVGLPDTSYHDVCQSAPCSVAYPLERSLPPVTTPTKVTRAKSRRTAQLTGGFDLYRHEPFD